MSKPQWLSTNFVAPEMIDAMPVKIKGRMGSETRGILKVEDKNNDGQITVSASYNSSPFSDSNVPEKFYLTQQQLDDFLNKGSFCVLIAPPKKSEISN